MKRWYNNTIEWLLIICLMCSFFSNTCIAAEAFESSISLEGFSDYQVFQRDIGGTSKTIPLTGMYAGMNISYMQYRVVKCDNREEVIPWTNISINTSDKTFSGQMTVPQGGWYNAELRAMDDGNNPVATISQSKKWGVGIIILCAGQSNMSGRGVEPYIAANNLLANFNNEGQWSHLSDPYDADGSGISYDNNAGGSLVPALGNELTRQLNIPVAFVPAAKGGSALYGTSNGSWLRRTASDHADSANLYGNAIQRSRAAGGVELIVWNQGETDAENHVSKETYMSAFMTMLNNFREDLYSTIPIFICQLSTSTNSTVTDEDMTAIRSAQNDLDNGSDIFMSATAMDLVRQDSWHFISSSYQILGTRIAKGIKYYFEKSAYYRGPRILKVSYKDSAKNIIDVKIEHSGGYDITPNSGITGFEIFDSGSPVTITAAQRLNSSTVRITLASSVAGIGTLRYLYGKTPAITGIIKDNTSLRLPLEGTTSNLIIENGPSNELAADPPEPQGASFRVACIGDSITAGSGLLNEQKYPYILGNFLGLNYSVTNYGVSGRTMLKNGDNPYWNEVAFANSKNSSPDIVIIMLGTNDAKPANWTGKDRFLIDYKDMIDTYKELPSHPEVYVCLPPTVYNSGGFSISPLNLQNEVLPLVRQAALETGCRLIDVNAATTNMEQNFPDNVHPNVEGAEIIANTMYNALIAPSQVSGKLAVLDVQNVKFTDADTGRSQPIIKAGNIKCSATAVNNSDKLLNGIMVMVLLKDDLIYKIQFKNFQTNPRDEYLPSMSFFEDVISVPDNKARYDIKVMMLDGFNKLHPLCEKSLLTAVADGLYTVENLSGDISSGGVLLTWSLPYHTVNGFNIYRDDILIGSVDGSITSYSDKTGLEMETTYKYKVAAYDSRQEEYSEYSQVEIQTAYIKQLDNCDVTTGWSVGSPNILSLDTVDNKEGTGCVRNEGTRTTILFQKTYATPVDSGVTEENGAIQFWYYISDVTKLKTTGNIQIRSNTSDTDSYSWAPSSVLPGLKNGWNHITLKFKDASVNGTPQLNKIILFRMYLYSIGTESAPVSLITKIDDISFIKVW